MTRNDVRERVEQYAESHPDTGTIEVLGALKLPPEHRSLVEDVIDGGDGDPPRGSTVEHRTGDAKGGCEAGSSGSLPTVAFDSIDDPEFEGSTEAVREHYRRAGPLLDALESVGDAPIAGFTGNSGIYTKRYETELELHELEAGHRAHRRPIALGRDRADLLNAIEFDPDEPSWRSAYLHLPYKDADTLFDGAYLDAERYDADEWFDGGEGLPNYADLRGVPFWIDVDLADDRDDALDPDDETEYGADLKARRGDLDPRELRLVERAFEEIVAEVAAVYDLPTEAIAAFDSGGGFYPFGPAAATLPIAERYDDPEVRGRLFDEFTDRINDHVVETIVPRVEERVPGAEHLLDVDALLNKNRQSKAPGSIHKTHDVVVTPLRDEGGAVDYSPTTVSEFAENDDLREHTIAETRKFTQDTPETRACVEPLVATLFPQYYDREGVDGWEDALDAWLADDWRRRRDRTHATARDDLRRRERREEQCEELADELDREPTDDEVSAALADQQVTTVRQDVFDDVDRIDVAEVVRKYAADEWDTSSRGHETTFDPSWRTSGSGKSCAVPNGGDTFVDNSCNGGGGPTKAYALGEEIINNADDDLDGEDWGKAVDGLRGEGYDIRVYVPEAGEEYDETPYWAIVEAGVTLGVFDADDTVYRDSNSETNEVVAETADEADDYDGETYEGCPRGTFNDVLDALDDADIDHGREHIDGGVSAGGQQHAPESCAPPGLVREGFDREQRWNELQSGRYEDWLDRNRPTLIWGDDAGSGKTTNAALAAAARERPHTVLFDKHEKAREFITDPVTPDGYFHLKGGEQPVEPCCMDAAVRAPEGETPECPTHGCHDDWPRMNPIYERPAEDDLRQRYEALVGGVGPRRALVILDDDGDLLDDNPWIEQFDGLDSRDRVVGVHEYQQLKTAVGDRDPILDETPRLLADGQRVTVDGLSRAQLRLDDLADLGTFEEGKRENLRALAEFAADLRDAIAGDGSATIDGLDAPAFEWEEYFDLRDPISGEGVNRDLKTETLAQLKLTYNEGLVSRIREGEWNGEPFCIDALLAAAAEAGLADVPARQAIAAPATLEACPWCGGGLANDNGARVCASDDCSWHEAENTVTRKDSEPARAIAWLDADTEDLDRDGRPGLGSKVLPPAGDLPEPLVLDATATPSKVAAFYGEEDIDVTGDEPLDLDGRLNVTQVLDGQYHAQTIRDTESLQDRIQSVVDTAGKLYDSPLFGIRRDLIPLFEFPENGEVLVYGGARGLNREQCDAVVCIGAPHPNMNEIQRTAELLAMDRDDLRADGAEYSTRRDAPNPPVYRKLLYESENGTGLAVPTKAYSGVAGALFREAREKELEQFVHRIRPLLVEDAEPAKDAYLLTNVPTDLPVDDVVEFDELAGDLSAVFPVTEGALRLLGHARDVLASDGPDGFREGALVERRADGELANKVRGWHRLAQVCGEDVTRRTVRNWVDELEAVGLLTPEKYEQHAGVSYTADFSTSKRAFQVLTVNAGFEVAALRRFGRKVRESNGALDWLAWAESVFDLSGDRCGWDPPPSPAG